MGCTVSLSRTVFTPSTCLVTSTASVRCRSSGTVPASCTAPRRVFTWMSPDDRSFVASSAAFTLVVIAVSRSFVPALVECDDDAPFISVARFAVFAPVMSFGPFALPFALPFAPPVA
ncbi:conserved hypothetical protein, partial [Burkholderia pseudomallei Pakistan 9]